MATPSRKSSKVRATTSTPATQSGGAGKAAPAVKAVGSPAQRTAAVAKRGGRQLTKKAPPANAKADATKKLPVALSGTKAQDKPKKAKLVRDSFTIPKLEYATIADVKARALTLGREVRKSEVIRAGLAALKNLSEEALAKLLAGVPKIKTGRPKKHR